MIVGLGLIAIYLVSPIDLLPLNPIDDMAVVIGGLTLVFKGFGMENEAPGG